MELRKKAIRWLENNRGLVILIFCLPASLLFDLVLRTWVWIQRKISPAAGHTHDQRVADIQAQVCIEIHKRHFSTLWILSLILLTNSIPGAPVERCRTSKKETSLHISSKLAKFICDFFQKGTNPNP